MMLAVKQRMILGGEIYDVEPGRGISGPEVAPEHEDECRAMPRETWEEVGAEEKSGAPEISTDAVREKLKAAGVKIQRGRLSLERLIALAEENGVELQ